MKKTVQTIVVALLLGSTLTNAQKISCGGAFDLSVCSDHTVRAWGENNYGELGNGTSTNSNVPVQVSGLTNVIAVSGGGYHSLALKNDGTVWA
jgi:alpha-tubulin suppressor-like RCC1 family protein